MRRKVMLPLLLAVLLPGAALLLFACAPLKTFDVLMPKDGASVQRAEGIAYGGDPRQRLDIYVPRAPAAAPRPVIVFFYGGSWQFGARDDYRFVGRALAARGFVTVIPDYRLTPAAPYPAFLHDSADAVRWVVAHIGGYGGDGARIVLAGHSAGAYNAAMLALDPRWLGSDRRLVKGFAGLAGPYDFAPFDDPVTIAVFGAWPHPAETQPIGYALPGAPRALLAWGADDTRVMPRNSIALAARLRAAGDAVETHGYPGIGHVGLVTAFARPFRNRAPVLGDVAAFAARVTAVCVVSPKG